MYLGETHPDLERLNALELQSLEIQKQKLEVAELQWQRSVWGRMLHGWTPVILAAIALVGGWLTNHFSKERAELAKIREAFEREQSYARAIETIGSDGGVVIVTSANGHITNQLNFAVPTYWWSKNGGQIPVEKDAATASLGRDTAKAIASLKYVELIDFGNRRVTDFDLEQLAGISDLHTLRINDSTITDAGLAHLAAFRNLIELDLSDSKVKGPGLAHFIGHPSLQEIAVPHDVDYEVTLRFLRQAPSLKEIEIGYPDLVQFEPEFAVFDKPSGIRILRGNTKEEFFESFTDSALDVQRKAMERAKKFEAGEWH